MRKSYRMAELCQALKKSPSGYYAWRLPQDNPSKRAVEYEPISTKIKFIHAHRHKKAYGSPRMTVELNDQGIPCSRNRVARIMRP